METNPLLARRVIPARERLQKALVVLALTAGAVAAAWAFAGASFELDRRIVLLLASIAAFGLSLSAFFWFKKEEQATSKANAVFIRRRIDDDRQGRTWVSRLAYNIKRFLAGIVILVGVLIVLAGVGVLCLQLYAYLKTGDWKSVSTLSVASLQFSWLKSPQSWFGLHEIVSDMLGILPLSLALVLLGLLVAGFGSALRQRVSG